MLTARRLLIEDEQVMSLVTSFVSPWSFPLAIAYAGAERLATGVSGDRYLTRGDDERKAESVYP